MQTSGKDTAGRGAQQVQMPGGQERNGVAAARRLGGEGLGREGQTGTGRLEPERAKVKTSL